MSTLGAVAPNLVPFQSFLDHPVLNVVVTVIGLSMLLMSRRGHHSQVVQTGGSSTIALAFIALATIVAGPLALGLWILGQIGVH